MKICAALLCSLVLMGVSDAYRHNRMRRTRTHYVQENPRAPRYMKLLKKVLNARSWKQNITPRVVYEPPETIQEVFTKNVGNKAFYKINFTVRRRSQQFTESICTIEIVVRPNEFDERVQTFRCSKAVIPVNSWN